MFSRFFLFVGLFNAMLIKKILINDLKKEQKSINIDCTNSEIHYNLKNFPLTREIDQLS